MTGFARSTIAALFYAEPDRIAFSGLVSELASTLLHTADGGLDIHTAYDDFVVFDLSDKRIVLAHSDLATDFPDAARRNGCATAVIVSVGDKPGVPGVEGHGALCDDLTQRIEARRPALGAVTIESDTALDEDSFDLLLEDIVGSYEEAAEPPAQMPDFGADAFELITLPEAIAERHFAPPDAPRREAARPALPAPAPAPPRDSRAVLLDPFHPRDLTRSLAARFDREIEAREAAREAPRPIPVKRSPGPTLFPSTTYGERRPLPPPRNTRATSAFARLRKQGHVAPQEALFPETAVARAQPLVHRGAIHAVNLATMAFSLPIGAFLMTLAILGRESLTMSARMTAVTGAGMGIAQNDSIAGFVLNLI